MVIAAMPMDIHQLKLCELSLTKGYDGSSYICPIFMTIDCTSLCTSVMGVRYTVPFLSVSFLFPWTVLWNQSWVWTHCSFLKVMKPSHNYPPYCCPRSVKEQQSIHVSVLGKPFFLLISVEGRWCWWVALYACWELLNKFQIPMLQGKKVKPFKAINQLTFGQR